MVTDLLHEIMQATLAGLVFGPADWRASRTAPPKDLRSCGVAWRLRKGVQSAKTLRKVLRLSDLVVS
jgi:hypothetical protein